MVSVRESDILDKFGIAEGIWEVIATTISKKGKVNAAPMGLVRGKSSVFIRMYPCDTLRNVAETNFLVANICHDPMAFVTYAFEDADQDAWLDEKHLVLKCADAWLHFRAVSIEYSRPSLVTLKPTHGEVLSKKLRPPNRGLNAVIEAAIYATRCTKDEKLRELIDFYHGIVLKCGGRREKEAMGRLCKYIDRNHSFPMK